MAHKTNRSDIIDACAVALSLKSCAACAKLKSCTKRKDHWGMKCEEFERSERFSNAIEQYQVEAVFTALGE